MKQLIRPPLVSALTGYILSFSTLQSNAAISDSFTVFNPTGAVFQSVSVDEANEIPNNIYILDFPDLADPGQFGNFTTLTEPDGSLSDVFGVIINQDGARLAFVSDSDTVAVDPSFGSGASFTFPEALGVFDGNATKYLNPTLQNLGYTATFVSDVESVGVPDTGTTGPLLGIALSGLMFLRRRRS